MNGKFLPLLTLLISLSLSASAQSPQYLALVDSAATAIDCHDWEKAADNLRAAMRLEPGLPGNILLMSNLGLVEFYDGRADRSVATLSDAIAMAPNAVVLRNNRARVLAALGRDREAMADYSHALSVDSTSADALAGRVMLLLAADSLELATRDIERLEHLRPDDRTTLLARASLLQATGNYIDAIKYFTRLIEQSPDDELLLARATCYILTENLSDATVDLNEAIKLNPENPDLYERRSTIHIICYRNAEAQADLKRAAELRKAKKG